VELHENSRDLAAFITPFGVYVPLRISMGLKCAPAYFQYIMQEDVLIGVVFTSAELYIDDIMVFGKDDEDFLKNLRLVLEILKERNLTVNPAKAKICVSEVEAVGHVLDQFGISMSEEKIGKVMNFPMPKYGRQLKQFLGLANYFRAHVQNHSMMARPLDQLVAKYDETKNRVIPWTDELRDAFRALQQAIGVCPKLYFLQEEGEIFLDTDASDYGIGAYLYQQVQVDDAVTMQKKLQDNPIAFMSQSLTPTQRRWPTIAKECYAIYQALRGWEYLIGGRFFTIRTDHRNLLHLNDKSPKIVNWKLAIQEFNFQIEYIPGPTNVVADSLSRIVQEESDHEQYKEASESVALLEEPGNDTLAIEFALEILASTREGQESVREAQQIQDSSIQLMTRDWADAMRQARRENRPLVPPAHEEQFRPLPEQIQFLHKCHNDFVGHGGVVRTLTLLRNMGQSWPNMRRHVDLFVKNCGLCQKMREIRPVVHARQFTTVPYDPFARVNIDTMGPLPEDENGNQFIFVMVDAFSRFVELVPSTANDADKWAKALIGFMGRYGVPSTITSDRGTEFANDVFKSVTQLVGTRHLPSIAHSKEENALVERRNKEVGRHLNGFVHDNRLRSRWSVVLPLVQRILNAAPNAVTGVSPAQLIFGNSVDLDRGIFLPTEEREGTEGVTPSIKQYLDKLLAAQSVCIEIARQKQLLFDVSNLTREGEEDAEPRQNTEFGVNSYVLLRYPNTGVVNGGRPDKLRTRWQGPFRVIERIGDRYKLQNLVTLREIERHVADLAPFRHDLNIEHPRVSAWKDAEQFEIDSIISHRGDFQRKKTLMFRVRWKGYDESQDTDEPWATLRMTAQLHAYLRMIGKADQIPVRFR
jgi:putative transposase